MHAFWLGSALGFLVGALVGLASAHRHTEPPDDDHPDTGEQW